MIVAVSVRFAGTVRLSIRDVRVRMEVGLMVVVESCYYCLLACYY